jgi:hypothetical protein
MIPIMLRRAINDSLHLEVPGNVYMLVAIPLKGGFVPCNPFPGPVNVFNDPRRQEVVA